MGLAALCYFATFIITTHYGRSEAIKCSYAVTHSPYFLGPLSGRASYECCLFQRAANTKVLGDAAEHYSLSQFAFAGLPGTKMPDN